MSDICVVSGLHKQYKVGEVTVHALRGVSMRLAEGDFAVIVGPSGSGKSTLLNIIGGMDTPTSGQVLYKGEDIATWNEAQITAYRRHEVGFVFQLYNLMSFLTAKENVELASELVREKALPSSEVLRSVGLSERQHHFPSQLSGGEQQRVAIARVVAKRPSILLCDEPTGALDYETGKGILSLLRHINRTYGTTVVLITHNAAIAKMGDLVLRMRSGEIVESVRNPSPLDAEAIEW